MKGFVNALVQLLWFGSLAACVVLEDAQHPAAVVVLFVAGHLFVTGVLCSLIVRRLESTALPDWLVDTVLGFCASHVCILLVLYAGPFGSEAPRIPGAGTLAWMELTLRVGLAVVLVCAAAVACKAPLRRFIAPA